MAGCQGSQAGSAGPGLSAARTVASAGHAPGDGSTAGAGSVATASPPTTSPARTVPAAVTRTPELADVYVVADCAAAAPYPLSREPVSITLACADAGIGVQDMLWTSWTTRAATGTGLLWEKLCVPDCADGKMGYYPVNVTLSAVRASAKGPWFSELTVSWQGSRPPNQTPDTFMLMPPR